MARFFQELRRRNVFRIAAAYLVTAWLLIQIIVSVKAPLRLPDWSDTLVIVLLAAGFPVACLLAWAYEVTPDGIRSESGPPAGAAPAPRGFKAVDYALAALVAVVVGFVVADRLIDGDGDGGPPVVLVLPFDNSTDDANQAYLADGLTQDLIIDLGKLSGLSVMGRMTSFSFKGQAISTREIAEAYGVDFIVNGGIGRVADSIRVNAQLVEAMTGQGVWSERYTHGVDELSMVWDDVVDQIVDALSVRMTQSEQQARAAQYRPDFRAYDLYLQAREIFQSKTDGRIADSLALYRRSWEADPEFARAYAGYARALADVWQENAIEVRVNALARQEAEQAAARALTLDPDLAEAHAVNALLSLGDGSLDAAVRSAAMAVDLDPSSIDARTVLVIVLGFAGRLDDALAEMQAALALDPRPSPFVSTYHGWILFMNRRFDEAIDVLERLDRTRDPLENEYTIGAMTIESLLASAYAEAGRLDDAREQVDRLLAKNPWQSLRHYRASFGLHDRGEDVEFRIDALRKAGVPELPFDLDVSGFERLSREELQALIAGTVWEGFDRGRQQPFQQAFQPDGTTHHLGLGPRPSSNSGTAFVREDRLCIRFQFAYWGQDHCGEVYRNPDGTAADRNEYLFVQILAFDFAVRAP